MLPEEIIKKIRLIDIRTRLLVDQLFSGEYHSVFKGRGIEFSEVREYSYGDDTRTIDWNVTARLGRPYVKVYEEERELTVFILFDASSSTLFGSQGGTKRDIMVELGALFTFSAVENNDLVGAALFSDRVEKYIPPRKDKIHALRVLRELLYIRPESASTNLKAAFDFINTLKIRRSVVFVISDFFDELRENEFKMTAKKHDVIPVVVTDPLEIGLTGLRGVIHLRDIESGARRYIDLKNQTIKAGFRANFNKNHAAWKTLFTSTGIESIEVSTGAPYIKPLFEFFHRRARKL